MLLEILTFLKQSHSTGIVSVQILPGNFSDETHEVKMVLCIAQTFVTIHRCLRKRLKN